MAPGCWTPGCGGTGPPAVTCRGPWLDVNVIFFVVAMLSAIGTVTLALFRQILFYSRRARITRQQEQNRALSRKQQELTETYRKKQEAVKQGEQDRKAFATQIAEVQRRIKQAQAENYIVVHELGEAGAPRRLFGLHMTMASTIMLGQTVVKDGKLRGSPHVVEVWAPDADAALRLARQAYPAEAGFTLSKPVPVVAPEAA